MTEKTTTKAAKSKKDPNEEGKPTTAAAPSTNTATTKNATKEETPKKPGVSFSADTKTTTKLRPTKPGRIKLGGASSGPLELTLPEMSRKVTLEPNVWRECGIPLGLLFFAILFCWGISDIGLNGGKNHNRLDVIGKVNSKLIQNQFKKRGGYMAPNCTMYFTKSSIPGAGDSIFAGRDYEVGEVVFPGGDFLPASLDDESNQLFIQQYAFNLKHHHLLANLEGNTFVRLHPSTTSLEALDKTAFAVRASRPIHAGDELFLPLALHPRSQLMMNGNLLFQNIPTRDDYTKAAEMILDEIRQFRRRKRDTKTATAKAREIEANLDLIYKTAQTLNPVVAKFLPLKKPELDRWIQSPPTIESIGLDAMDNKTVNALAINAQCLSYVTTAATEITAEAPSIVITTKEISAGAVVMPVPLLLLSITMREESCNVNAETGQCLIPNPDTTNTADNAKGNINPPNHLSRSHCWGHKDLPMLLLCPLSIASKMTIVVDDDSIDDQANTPNVELRWNGFNSHNKKSHALPVEQVASLYTTQLQLDVVALRPLEKGEALRVKLGPPVDGAFASIPDNLVPGKWRSKQ